MRISNFFAVFLLAIMISACSVSQVEAGNNSESLREIVNDSETTFVDVRIPAEFEQKSVKNAVNIPLATIEQNLEFFKKQKKVVLFCNRGSQANEALKILKKNGVENVVTGKTVNNVIAIQNENK